MTGLSGSITAEKRRRFAVLLALVALSFAAFANSVPGDYVFDDVKIVKINPVIRSLKNIPQILLNAFTRKRLAKEGMKVDTGYRPIRYISYTIDYQFTGENPAGYHISNILYHSLVSFLLFLLLMRLGAGFFGATVAAALFCVHPVNTEAVAYITSRKELLCALFFLAAFLTYLSNREKPSVGRILLLSLFFVLALFSKEMALSFFGVLLLYELVKSGWRGSIRETIRGFFKHLSERKLLLPLGVVFGISVAYALYSLYIKNPAGLGKEWVGYWGGSFLNSLLSVGRAFLHYIRLMIFPYPLSADYSGEVFPPSTGLLTPPTTILALLVHLGLLSLAVFLLIRKRFVIPFAILFFYVALIPVSQVFPTPERVAERFLYIPMFAFALLVAFGLEKLQEKKPAVALVFLLFPLYFALTVERNYDWRSNETLFGAVLRRHPNCARAHFAVGAALAEKGDLDGALEHFRRVVELLPPEKQKGWLRGYVLNARRGIASVLLQKGELGEAAEELESLIVEKDVLGRVMGEVPEFLHLHFDLGKVYFGMKEYKAAVAEFKKVLELAAATPPESDPSKFISESHYYIGRIRSAEGAYTDAAESFEKAFEAAPTDALRLQMRFHQALALFDSARFQNANELFIDVVFLADKLLDKGEGDVSAILNAKKQSELMMARVRKHLGDIDGALRSIAELKEKYPDWWLPFYEEAQVFFLLGRLNEAEDAARVTLRWVSDEDGIAAFKELLAAITLKRESKAPKRPLSVRLGRLLTAAKELLKRKKTEEAKELLEKLLAHRVSVPSGDEDSFYFFAEAQLILLEKGMLELNKVSVAEARRLVGLSERLESIDDGKKALLYRRLAEFFKRLGDKDGELECWRKVVEKNPDYLGAHFRLALLLFEKKDYETALKHFEESIRQGYLVAESLYRIGKIRYAQKDYEGARKSWLRFIESASDADIEKVREVTELLSNPNFKDAEEK